MIDRKSCLFDTVVRMIPYHGGKTATKQQEPTALGGGSVQQKLSCCGGIQPAERCSFARTRTRRRRALPFLRSHARPLTGTQISVLSWHAERACAQCLRLLRLSDGKATLAFPTREDGCLFGKSKFNAETPKSQGRGMPRAHHQHQI